MIERVVICGGASPRDTVRTGCQSVSEAGSTHMGQAEESNNSQATTSLPSSQNSTRPYPVQETIQHDTAAKGGS